MTRYSVNKEKAEFNAEILKTLLKLPGNKYCSDCKKNDHPRWASWSLGVFLCIRCSGVHRSMGTHISRVKSVDLDAWTNEQLENMIRWGNTRANKYWEAKLIPGHIPSESKIENYIRSKYETKKWVMDGPIPDPSTLDNDSEIFCNISNNDISEKQASFTTSKNLASKSHTKDKFSSSNLFCSSENGTAFPCHQNSFSSQDFIKSNDSFDSNLDNHTNTLKLNLSTSQTQMKTSKADLKSSILSLYSITPASRSNNVTNNSAIDTSSYETLEKSKHEKKPSNSLKNISEDLQDLKFSEKQETLDTSQSRDFSNPSVSYLFNTRKITPTFSSFDISVAKDQVSDVNYSNTTKFTEDILSNNDISKSEKIHVKDDMIESNILEDSMPDLSIKQWDNDSVAFNSFQSPPLLFTASDTLSFHVSPWSTDKPKEANSNFDNYHSSILYDQDICDKNSLFYDNSIISTTDVWK